MRHNLSGHTRSNIMKLQIDQLISRESDIKQICSLIPAYFDYRTLLFREKIHGKLSSRRKKEKWLVRRSQKASNQDDQNSSGHYNFGRLSRCWALSIPQCMRSPNEAAKNCELWIFRGPPTGAPDGVWRDGGMRPFSWRDSGMRDFFWRDSGIPSLGEMRDMTHFRAGFQDEQFFG